VREVLTFCLSEPEVVLTLNFPANLKKLSLMEIIMSSTVLKTGLPTGSSASIYLSNSANRCQVKGTKKSRIYCRRGRRKLFIVGKKREQAWDSWI